MNNPLVSIICTCYNHESYIKGALDSVLYQSYAHIELIIINNGSKDFSAKVIDTWIKSKKAKKDYTLISHPGGINYCKSFNQGLQLAKGKYVIDLSGDDLLISNHVTIAVEALERSLDASVYFCNAYLEGETERTFYPVDRRGRPTKEVLSGDIYLKVARENYLCASTMVFRREVLIREGGYDEELSYEDFDIITRLARRHKFIFNGNLGVRKRILKTSFSAKQYSIKSSIMLPSTLSVCRKIKAMNKTKEENQALQFRVMYEAKHALASANFDIAAEFLKLAREIGVSGLQHQLFLIWEKGRYDLSSIYKAFILKPSSKR